MRSSHLSARAVLHGVLIAIVSALPLTGCQLSGATSQSSQAKAPPETETRIVKHAMGEIPVPSAPQRVVVLDTGELDSVLALGVKPVGAVLAIADQPIQEYLKDRTEGITIVGTIAQPSLEKIAALKPDLILSSKLRHEAIYSQLSQIAPTVFTETTGVAWKENLKVHADALNRSEDGDRLMKAYLARTEAFKAALGPRVGQVRVSVVRFTQDRVRAYAVGSFSGTILQDAGVARPPLQQARSTFVEVGQELIPEMDADVLFVSRFGDTGATEARFRQDPLWSRLDVVKRGAIHEVGDDYWMLGIGPLAANRVLDDLFAHVAGQP
jgi:iron complex transport system substrate-binding protein